MFFSDEEEEDVFMNEGDGPVIVGIKVNCFQCLATLNILNNFQRVT